MNQLDGFLQANHEVGWSIEMSKGINSKQSFDPNLLVRTVQDDVKRTVPADQIR